MPYDPLQNPGHYLPTEYANGDRQFNQATHIKSVEVEVVQDDEDLEEF